MTDGTTRKGSALLLKGLIYTVNGTSSLVFTGSQAGINVVANSTSIDLSVYCITLEIKGRIRETFSIWSLTTSQSEDNWEVDHPANINPQFSFSELINKSYQNTKLRQDLEEHYGKRYSEIDMFGNGMTIASVLETALIENEPRESVHPLSAVCVVHGAMRLWRLEGTSHLTCYVKWRLDHGA